MNIRPTSRMKHGFRIKRMGRRPVARRSSELWLLAGLLFLAALAPRLPGLRLFLTSDENTNIFFAGSDVIVAFLQGDLRDTYWHFYPGVTMSWLDAIGMAGQYFIEALSGAALPPFADYVYSDILNLVVANRLPYAVLTATAVPAVYLLARRILSERAAFLGALLMAFDPFYLAHSRVAHGDAPVAVFMALSILAFLAYIRQGMESETPQEAGIQPLPPYALFPAPLALLIASAVFGGLAALTKAPGPFVALFITGLALLYAGQSIYQAAGRRSNPVKQPAAASPPHLMFYVARIAVRWLAIVALWGVISLATFVLFWPAMWVDPLGTFGRTWTETFDKVDAGHLVYFLGRPTLDPGPWFYFYVIPFRLTPITLLGSLLSLLWLIEALLNSWGRGWMAIIPVRRRFSLHNPLLLLWLFTLGLLLFGNLSPKKQDRYLLPLFPFLDLLAALGWLGLIDLLWRFLRPSLAGLETALKHASGRYVIRRPRLAVLLSYFVPGIGVLTLIFIHFIPVLTYYPYYLAYFNPLLGGPVRAARTTLMGWGEGMEQVAAYLNTKPGAENLYVASTPSQTLLPYFAGTGENFYTNDVALRADYVVLYLAQMQRLAPSPEIVGYFEAQQPEYVVTIKEVPYAKLYPGPKVILTDLPAGATPINVGLEDKLRLAGYELAAPPSQTALDLTLYWHALVPLSSDYTVSVRARSETGEWLAQQDSWPVGGLLPTSQWRQGDYVADMHFLEVDRPEQAFDVEVVVYDAETGQSLGAPITIPLEAAGGGDS